MHLSNYKMAWAMPSSTVKTPLPLRQSILANPIFHQFLACYRRSDDKPNYYPMWVKYNPFNLDWGHLKKLGIQTINTGKLPPYFTFEQLLNAVGYQIN